MSQKRLWVAAIIIALVIVIGFVFSVPHVRDIAQSPPQVTMTIPTVTLHDTFKKGIHTIVGSVETTDACTGVTATSTLEGDASSTESILLSLSIPEDTGVCLELPTRTNFSTTITAPALLPITATINGSVASTTSS
ncbi:MAG: hypothetical protein ACYC6X_02870 [Minisyncoccota bacterium]